MELSLNRLRMLRELSRRGTLTEAAAALHYTPSAVSQQLAALEREVAVPLLEHVGRRVRLTEIGRVLAQHAEEILAAEERARIALEQARETLTADLTVGVLATLAGTLVPPTLATLAERHPPGCTSGPGRSYRRRPRPPYGTATSTWRSYWTIPPPPAPVPWTARWRALWSAWSSSTSSPRTAPWAHRRPPAHPPRSRPRPPPRRGPRTGTARPRAPPWTSRSWPAAPGVASGTDTEFGRALSAVCRTAGFTPRIAHQIDEQATAMAMVATGLGITLVAELALPLRPANVDVFPFRDPIRRRITVIRRTSTRDRPSELAFVRAALDTAAALRLLEDPDGR